MRFFMLNMKNFSTCIKTNVSKIVTQTILKLDDIRLILLTSCT